jgi:hypothetical protein
LKRAAVSRRLGQTVGDSLERLVDATGDAVGVSEGRPTMWEFQDGVGAPADVHSLADASEPWRVLSFMRHRPALLDHAAAEHEHVRLLGRESNVRRSDGPDLGDLAAEVMDHGRELHRDAQAERLRQLPREREAVRYAPGCAIRVAEVPERICGEDVARNARIIARMLVGEVAVSVEARMPTQFGVCSVCKTSIPMATKYYRCSVSTCNSGRWKLRFCRVRCWDIRLPEARHRDAGAIEETARPSTHNRNPRTGQAASVPRGSSTMLLHGRERTPSSVG